MKKTESPVNETVSELLAGSFGKLVLPAIILQSVLIGGGYATGREVVAYGAKFGAWGWLAVLVIFVGFSVLAALTFEVARLFRAYDYKSFVRRLIGRFWPAFDLLYGAMAILIIAVMASAASNIMEQTLGVPPAAGTLLIIVATGALTFYGAGVIEAFKSVGTLFLYVAYLLFGVLVLSSRWTDVATAFATADVSYFPEATAGAAIVAGVLYVGYNLAVFPAVLFTLHRQTSRRETLTAGLLAGFLMTLPFTLTYLCLMAFYPAPEVMDAPVPWLQMLDSVGGPAVIAGFGVVIGWTLLETSVGLIHALIDRIDKALEVAQGTDGERSEAAGLSRLQSGALGAGILVAAALLSRVGIIALVAEGYTMMAYFFIAIFAVPLLVVGTIYLFRPPRKAGLEAAGETAGSGRPVGAGLDGAETDGSGTAGAGADSVESADASR